MMIPDDLLYTESHEWIKREGENIRVGITDHAQSELTDVVYVELPERMATHKPVCWDCHIVESLYRLHPEMVVERPNHWAHYH